MTLDSAEASSVLMKVTGANKPNNEFKSSATRRGSQWATMMWRTLPRTPLTSGVDTSSSSSSMLGTKGLVVAWSPLVVGLDVSELYVLYGLWGREW
jgi:hypothetical protein